MKRLIVLAGLAMVPAVAFPHRALPARVRIVKNCIAAPPRIVIHLRGTLCAIFLAAFLPPGVGVASAPYPIALIGSAHALVRANHSTKSR